MTCNPTPPLSPAEFVALIDRCVSALSGTSDWPRLAAYGLIPVAVVLAVVYLVLRWGRR